MTARGTAGGRGPGAMFAILGATVFVAAAAVLVLEILAGRILAPYVGVTLRSFTAIIGTILGAIALGAWAGGRLADTVDPRRALGPVLAAGAVLAVVTPAAVDAVAGSWSGDDPLQIVSLAVVGFFAPAAVLSMVTPLAAKAALHSLDRTGRVVGTLSALATAGALFGTFVTGFVLLGALPSRPITWIVAAVLFATAAAVSMAPGRSWLFGAGLLLGVGLVTSAAIPRPCDTETAYFCVDVRIDPARPSGRELILDTLRHSYVDVDDPTYLGSRYARVIADVIAAVEPSGPSHALFIGGGGFTLPRYLQAAYGTRSTVLELDAAVVAVAEEELGLVGGEWLQVVTGDARLTLRGLPDGSYDVAVGDAFGGRSVPWHLTTVEFLTEVRDRLRPGGVYVMNLIDYPPAAFARAEVATLRRVFDNVAVVAPPSLLEGTQGGNFVLVASDAPIPAGLSTSGIERVFTGAELAAFAGDARPLTDAFAPVDQLLGEP